MKLPTFQWQMSSTLSSFFPLLHCSTCKPVHHLPHFHDTHTHTEYRDAFALFDKRGDNKIDSDQVGDVLRALNLNPSEAEVKKIVQEVDPSG